MGFVSCSNDSKNSGFEDPYSLDYHVETLAAAIDSINDSVSTVSSVHGIILIKDSNTLSVCFR